MIKLFLVLLLTLCSCDPSPKEYLKVMKICKNECKDIVGISYPKAYFYISGKVAYLDCYCFDKNNKLYLLENVEVK